MSQDGAFGIGGPSGDEVDGEDIFPGELHGTEGRSEASAPEVEAPPLQVTAAQAWSRLKLAAVAGYTRLVLQWGESLAAAVLVRRRRGGFLLALPGALFTPEELQEARAGDFSGLMGPCADFRSRGRRDRYKRR